LKEEHVWRTCPPGGDGSSTTSSLLTINSALRKPPNERPAPILFRVPRSRASAFLLLAFAKQATGYKSNKESLSAGTYPGPTGVAAIIAQLADGRAAVVTCQPFALAADMSAANAAMSPASHFWSIGVDGGFHQSDDVAGPTSSA